MTTSYPSGLDSWSAVNGATHRDVAPTLSTRLNNLQDAVMAIQAELGTDPAGAAETVRARLDDIANDLGDLASDVGTLELTVGGLVSDVGDLQQDMTEVQGRVAVVNHGSANDVARPSVDLVFWIGSVEPLFAEAYDFFVNTASFSG